MDGSERGSERQRAMRVLSMQLRLSLIGMFECFATAVCRVRVGTDQLTAATQSNPFVVYVKRPRGGAQSYAAILIKIIIQILCSDEERGSTFMLEKGHTSTTHHY